MSRYECSEAGQTAVGVLVGREAVEEEVLYPGEMRAGEVALVLGDPYASAFAVTGTPDELRAFLAKAGAALDAAASPPCGKRVWPYTERNVCVLGKGHGGDHEDGEGRPFDHAGYRRDAAGQRGTRDVSGTDDGLGRVYSDTEFDAPGF